MPVFCHELFTRVAAVLVLAASMLVAGCASDSYAAKGATEGAATGALAGAVGAAATALIFGGNVGEAAARGAVYGGASGAVVGGVAGGRVDDQVAAQKAAEREQEIAKFRQEIGADAFNGFVALAECKYEVAVANAREAQRSRNRDFALAGLWVEALVEGERQQSQAVTSLIPQIVEQDEDIATPEAAETRMQETLVKIGDIRAEYNLPRQCTG